MKYTIGAAKTSLRPRLWVIGLIVLTVSLLVFDFVQSWRFMVYVFTGIR